MASSCFAGPQDFEIAHLEGELCSQPTSVCKSRARDGAVRVNHIGILLKNDS